MPYTLEVCVDSTASALAAMQGGAHRLELCADLVIGGTTPSLALLQQVKAETGLPVRALLRPRFGDFCYDRWELAQMAQSAARLVEAGADGIVTGVLTPEGDLDVEALQPIYAPPGQRPKGQAARWPAPSTGPLTSAGIPLPHWRPPGLWAFPPSLPAARPPAPRRGPPCCGGWWRPPGRSWRSLWGPV